MTLKTHAAKIALGVARTRLGGRLFGNWIWPIAGRYLSRKSIRQSEHFVAFFHPSPAYSFHVLLVPKKTIPSLDALGMDERGFFADLIQMVKSLADEYQLNEPGYRLIVNGGKYQEVPQLHWHMVADEAP